MKYKTFRIVRRGLASEVRAANGLTPAPGQGEGWGGGRNQASGMPAFDPHPSLPPARGKGQFPRAAAAPSCRTHRFFANAAARQDYGMLTKNN